MSMYRFLSLETAPHSSSGQIDRYYELTRVFQEEAAQFGPEEHKIAQKAISTVNTSLYAAVALDRTDSEEIAHRVHTLVRDETMYILFLDRFYESGDALSKSIADRCRKRVETLLQPEQHLSLSQLEAKLFTFWDVEREMKEKVQLQQPISDAELREFILRKSTDVFAYAHAAGCVCKFPRGVVLELYRQQLMRDVEDDLRDLGEDATQSMPNPLLIRLQQKKLYDPSVVHRQEDLMRAVQESGVSQEHSTFVQKYCSAISRSFPQEYLWMRECVPPSTSAV